ncbi:ATP-binding protein [Streptomyces prunicolor]|uniref:ATP-binding protein n=1 Tax=Streptomyces prunicolor TaxID=67348 RepID=UPI0007C470D6|nr:ATP-binding protein [Streptomyces prunicolor]
MDAFESDRSRYPTHSAYVKAARDHVRRVATSWGLVDSVVSDLALLASELATNVVLHVGQSNGQEFGVMLHLSPDNVRLEVRDTGPGMVSVQDPSADETTGRGLLMVDALADRWGIVTQVLGKIVFAEICLVKPSPPNRKGVSRV